MNEYSSRFCIRVPKRATSRDIGASGKRPASPKSPSMSKCPGVSRHEPQLGGMSVVGRRTAFEVRIL